VGGGALDPPSLATPRVLCKLGSTVYSLTPAPGGRVIAGCRSGVMAVLCASTGVVQATLAGHASLVLSLCVLRGDGHMRVLSGGADRVVRLHVVGATAAAAGGGSVVQPTREYSGHGNWVRAIVELSGERFASASDDTTIRIWALESGACLATVRGHRSCGLGLGVLSDEEQLVSAGYDKTLRVWDTRSYAAVATIEAPSEVLALLRLRDGSIAGGLQQGMVGVWNISRHELMRTLGSHKGSGIFRLAELPDGRLATVRSGSPDVRVWDAVSGACVGTCTPSTAPLSCCVTAAGWRWAATTAACLC